MDILIDAFVYLMEDLSDLLNDIVLLPSSIFRSLEMPVLGLLTGLLILVLLLSMLLVLMVVSQSQDPHTLLFNNVLNVSLLLKQQMFSNCVLNNGFADDRKHFIFSWWRSSEHKR